MIVLQFVHTLMAHVLAQQNSCKIFIYNQKTTIMKKLLCMVFLFYILSASLQAQPGIHQIDDSKGEAMIKHYRSLLIKKPKTVVFDEFNTADLQDLIKGSTSVKFILAAYPNDDTPDKKNYPIILLQIMNAEKTTIYYYGNVCPPPSDCPFPFNTRSF